MYGASLEIINVRDELIQIKVTLYNNVGFVRNSIHQNFIKKLNCWEWNILHLVCDMEKRENFLYSFFFFFT